MTLHNNVNRPKRVRDPRSHILHVASRLFLKKGYGGTSIDDVIALAGGSKATVAKHFGNKAGLFEAVVMQAAEGGLAATFQSGPHEDIASALNDFGIQVLKFYLEPASLMIYRSLIANVGGDSIPAQVLYVKGHGFIVGQLAKILQDFYDMGKIICVDPLAEAQRFLHLVRAGLYEETLLGLRNEATATAIKETVAAATKTMLHGLLIREA